MTSLSLQVACMELKMKNPERRLIQISVRLFEDQLDTLQILCDEKYRGRVNKSDLIREALDDKFEREINAK